MAPGGENSGGIARPSFPRVAECRLPVPSSQSLHLSVPSPYYGWLSVPSSYFAVAGRVRTIVPSNPSSVPSPDGTGLLSCIDRLVFLYKYPSISERIRSPYPYVSCVSWHVSWVYHSNSYITDLNDFGYTGPTWIHRHTSPQGSLTHPHVSRRITQYPTIRSRYTRIHTDTHSWIHNDTAHCILGYSSSDTD